MIWVFLSVVLWLMVVNRGFRRVAVRLAAAVAVGIGAGVNLAGRCADPLLRACCDHYSGPR
jgi:hypothetical protein